MPGAGRCHLDHLGFAARRDDHVRVEILELRVEDRAVPEIVARFALDLDGVGGRVDTGNIGEKGADRIPGRFLFGCERCGLRHGLFSLTIALSAYR